jgi:hypothetical protein
MQARQGLRPEKQGAPWPKKLLSESKRPQKGSFLSLDGDGWSQIAMNKEFCLNYQVKSCTCKGAWIKDPTVPVELSNQEPGAPKW